MSGFLLDTNCISELVRVKPDPLVFAWVRSTDEKLLHLSVLSLGEIRKGVNLLSTGRKRIELERWLEQDLPAQFAERLLPVNAEIAEIWGAMAAEAQLKGIANADYRWADCGHGETSRTYDRNPERERFSHVGNSGC